MADPDDLIRWVVLGDGAHAAALTAGLAKTFPGQVAATDLAAWTSEITKHRKYRNACPVLSSTDVPEVTRTSFDEHMQTLRLPWLMVHDGGSRLWIGPIFAAGTACYGCFARRLQARHPEAWDVEFAAEFVKDQPMSPAPPWAYALAAAAMPWVRDTVAGYVLKPLDRPGMSLGRLLSVQDCFRCSEGPPDA